MKGKASDHLSVCSLCHYILNGNFSPSAGDIIPSAHVDDIY